MRSFLTSACVALALASAASLFSACAATGPQRLDTATSSVEDLRSQLARGDAHVEAVIAALEAFEGTEDISRSFKDFQRALKELETSASRVRARTAAMRTRVQDHIEKWEAELAGIESEEAREISADRRQELEAAFEQLNAAMQDLKTEYEPLISSLRDVQLVLANDLSSGGLAAAESLIADAITKARAVSASVASTNDALEQAISQFKR